MFKFDTALQNLISQMFVSFENRDSQSLFLKSFVYSSLLKGSYNQYTSFLRRLIFSSITLFKEIVIIIYTCPCGFIFYLLSVFKGFSIMHVFSNVEDY